MGRTRITQVAVRVIFATSVQETEELEQFTRYLAGSRQLLGMGRDSIGVLREGHERA